MVSKLIDWLDVRLGVKHFYEEQIAFKVSGTLTFWNFFAGLTVFFILVQFITGIYMVAYYIPEPNLSHDSINAMCNTTTLGALFRNVHRWSATMVVLFISIHALHAMVRRAYRSPRELNWWTGIFLGIVVALLLITGVMAPWDWRSYWELVIWTDWAGHIPLIGGWLKEVILGNFSLGRNYAVHAFLFPITILSVGLIHIILERRLGVSDKYPPEEPSANKKEMKWWPTYLIRLSAIIVVVLIFIVVMANMFPVPDDAPAIPPYPDQGENIPGPEWFFMLLWQPFWFFTGRLKKYLVWMPLIPIIITFLLALLPFSHKLPIWNMKPIKGLLDKVRNMASGTLKNFLYALPVLLFGLVIGVGVYKSGHQAKVLGCSSCHNSGMGIRMGTPPVDVVGYYFKERQMQIGVGKYRAGKGTDVSGHVTATATQSYKDANWQMRHMYEPTFTW